jgi:hypothetical protein
MITMRKKNGISLTDQKQELGLFLNWFIKHYSTSSKEGLMFYMIAWKMKSASSR